MVAQTRHGAVSSPKKLAFREKLVGKGQTTDVLLKKLQTLHRELADLEQDHIDPASLNGVRKELIDKYILLHKDRGVKAYAACCLADILRLTAPDAPYTPGELRDIFQFFFRQLSKGLLASDCPYYAQFFHLLESLSTVKSVVLVCDLPNAEELMTEIFREFSAIVKRDLARKVEMFLGEILVALIDECQVLPGAVLEILLAQFMDKNARKENAQYRLAVHVCTATADKLQRHVAQHFTEHIVSEHDDDDFDDIRTEHELVQRLHAACPEVLVTVIPQLEEELQTEEVQLRLIVTETLGEMFAEPTHGLTLTRKFPMTWNVWLKRRNDKSSAVRIKFIEASSALLVRASASSEQRAAVEEALTTKLLDPDEKVRAAVCRVYSSMDYETALHHVKVDQLKAVAGRMLDKKPSVRAEAIRALGKLYALAYPEIESKDMAAIDHFAWIPNDMFAAVDEVLAEFILPLPTPSSAASSSKSVEVDEAAWTDRLLTVMASLDEEQSVASLLSFSTLQRARPTIFDLFVESCIANNGGVIDENEDSVKSKLASVIKYIAMSSPDPLKMGEDLNAFAKLNEQRLYKLLKTCMDPQTDLKGLVKASTEFHKRMDNVAPNLVSAMSFIVRQASLRTVNQSSIPTLLRRLQKPNTVTAANAAKLLAFVAKHSPILYKNHVGELAKSISAAEDAAGNPNSRLVEVAIQALAGLVRIDEGSVALDKRTFERIKHLALEGSPRQAKFAARFLTFSKNKDAVCDEVVESICDALGTASSEILVAHVAVLAQFARFAPNSFEHKSDVLMEFLLKQLLMVPTGRLDNAMETDEEWAEEAEVTDNLRAKILALKVCRNRSLAHAKSDKAVEMATPVLKMLATILELGGSLVPDADEDLKVMSRMRLQAAISLLHLATVPAFAQAIAPRFLKLALTVQDTCFNVRITFLKRLVSMLHPPRLPPYFNVIPFLTVHDPEQDVKTLASSYVTGVVKRLQPDQRMKHLEMMFLRLLHLLAHHPDFATTVDEMVDTAKYINFYLDMIANADTISLLYHLAMKAKTVRDAESQQHSENLYVVSELAQELIKLYAHHHGLNMTTFPGKVKLPSDILRPLPNAETSKMIMETVYLPAETAEWIKTQYTTPKEKKEKERKERVPTKRKAPAKPNGTTKRRKKRHSADSDEDEFGSDLSEDDVKSSEPPAVEDSSEDEEEQDGEEKLGRGQRTRAKRKQAKAAARNLRTRRATTPSSD
ncbi:unnamed protein product [Mycena citricolor]|uniref:Cohesin-associated protein Pds5 n=1 Tax=Mycena citricolor TaxID=2018698 RepID=A0AAD2HDV4_9AGAR|nr:unnamed protein product [Mycena citricolor]